MLPERDPAVREDNGKLVDISIAMKRVTDERGTQKLSARRNTS